MSDSRWYDTRCESIYEHGLSGCYRCDESRMRWKWISVCALDGSNLLWLHLEDLESRSNVHEHRVGQGQGTVMRRRSLLCV